MDEGGNMNTYWIYDNGHAKKIFATSLDDARAQLIKKYEKVAYELTSFKIATGKNDVSLGVLRYDPVLGWKWVTIEKKHAVVLRYGSVYLVKKNGSLGKKLGNAYKV